MRILVVEDDLAIQRAVQQGLRAAGFAVDAVHDLGPADEALAVNDYDCLVLDRLLPAGDALGFLQEARRRGMHTPALFLTARDTVDDRVAGFAAGGDDYLVKPFSLIELVARVRSLCRRAPALRPSLLHVADLQINLARREVRRAGVLLPLTARELCLLERLALVVGVVISRTELLEHCWDEEHDPLSNVVDVHVAALRRKLGEPALIRTVRGAGYLLDAPDV